MTRFRFFDKIAKYSWQTIATIFKSLFSYEEGQKHKVFTIAWICGIVAIGALGWGILLNFGDFEFNFHDWSDINGPRLTFVKQAILNQQLPLHSSDTASLHNVTDRYFSLPDVISSPQMFLLTFMGLSEYVFVNTLILFGIASAGLFWLRDKYKISLFAFSIFFFLFHFNGHIIAHTAVGHITWGGYYFFPWLIVLVMQLLEEKVGWVWVSKLAFVQFLMVLQGSEHHFVWILLFLAVVLFVVKEKWHWVLLGIGFSLSISAVRLFPPALELNDFQKTIGFVGGYPSLLGLWAGLVQLVGRNVILDYKINLPVLAVWETTIYIGLVGAFFLLGFGFYGLWKARSDDSPFGKLMLPILAITILSIGKLYGLLRLIPIPLLAGERATSRFFIVPFVFLLFIAVVTYQKWLDKNNQNPARYLIIQTLLFLNLVSDLFEQVMVWNIGSMAKAFPNVITNYENISVMNHIDTPYTAVLLAGALVSILSALFLIVMVLRERKLQSTIMSKVEDPSIVG